MLSIAIPTMRRWTFLQDSLPLMLERSEVAEVIICDETGEDIAAIRKSPIGSHPKLRLYVNETRLGIYWNKRKAAQLATSPWVAILDSDNSFPEAWFETVGEVLEKASPRQIFASADFSMVDMKTGKETKPCAHFSGLRVDKNNWNTLFHSPRWNFLLNDGNYIVPREATKLLPATVPKGYDEGALYCDAIFMLRLWILSGFQIWYVPELVYIHAVHSGSSWLSTEKPSTHAFNTTWWAIP